MEALSRDFQDLLALLAQHGVRHLVVGGYAVAAHGHPRYTKVVQLGREPGRVDPLTGVTGLAFADVYPRP